MRIINNLLDVNVTEEIFDAKMVKKGSHEETFNIYFHGLTFLEFTREEALEVYKALDNYVKIIGGEKDGK